MSTRLTFTDTVVIAGHTYFYRVYAVDSNGNLSAAASLIATTDAVHDVTLVAITGPSVSANPQIVLTGDMEVFGIVNSPI